MEQNVSVLPCVLNCFLKSKCFDGVHFFLAEGQHTLTKTIVTSKVGKLAMFTKKRSTCIGCKSVLDNDGKKNNIFVCKINKVKVQCGYAN